ncbi:MAG: hypothetical protein EBS48_07465 [Actinobacteria bacterium]|nr:hypothetical protein [Actinomycetota bacterium]NBR67265.1 hypothetical protein [Actinomycetota bacterium]NBU16837.1 hypothetical protein [Actinomycetota bacterium]
MRRSIDVVQLDLSEHPGGLDDAPVAWTVAVCDDYDDAEPRVQLTVEPLGGAGEGLVAHLSAANARRLRTALADALKEIGEQP